MTGDMEDPRVMEMLCSASRLDSRLSGIELFLVKSIPRWGGDVIMLENEIEPNKGVTKVLKPPGQHLKING